MNFLFSLILSQSKLFHVIVGRAALIMVEFWGKLFFDFTTFFNSKNYFFTLIFFWTSLTDIGSSYFWK